MTIITVPAVYRDGVLHPNTKLDLPEGVTVEIQITPRQPAGPGSPGSFGALAGIWGHLSEAELAQMEHDLAEIRRQTSERIESLARELDENSG